MTHFVRKCKDCKSVIAQCRCPSKNKTIEWDVCDACKKDTKTLQLEQEVENLQKYVKELETALRSARFTFSLQSSAWARAAADAITIILEKNK